MVDYEVQIAALERKVGQLTELDLLEKIAARLRLVSGNENTSIVRGPQAASSDGGRHDRDAAQHVLLPLEGAGCRA